METREQLALLAVADDGAVDTDAPGVQPRNAHEATWHAHREAPECRVYGRRLEVGELIEEGDLFESERLRAWAPTELAGLHVPAGAPRAYVRPLPDAKGARWHRHDRSGRAVFGHHVSPGDVLRPGDLFAGAVDWIRTLRPGRPAYPAGYIRPVLTLDKKEVGPMQNLKIHDRNGTMLFASAVDPTDQTPLRTAVTRAVREGVPLTRALLGCANLESAILRNAELAGADLTCADLTGADLRCARLTDATLTGAKLARADLSEAVLRDAQLDRADLSGANLRGADLDGADLTDANLKGADLTCADLQDVKLDGASLDEASLDEIRRDFWNVLEQATPIEIVAFWKKLRAGQIDGTCYEGDCACLVGTIAKIRGCAYSELKPDGSRPAERWMLAVRPGNTPENHPAARITERWVMVFLIAYAHMRVLQRRAVEQLLPPPLRHPAIVSRLFGH